MTVALDQAQPSSDADQFTGRCMSAGERACRIGLHDSMSQHCAGEWERARDFADLGRATWHEQRRDALREGARA